MTGLTELLQHPLVEQLAWALLHSLWQLAAIGLAAWCVLRLMRRRSANARYLVACATLATMIAAPVITFLYMQPNETPPLPVIGEPIGGPVFSAPSTPSSTAVAPIEQTQAAAPPSDGWRWSAALPYLTAFWLAGVLLGSLRLFGGWVMIQRLRLAGTRTMPGDWPSRVDELMKAMGLRRRVRVRASTKAAVPVALGVLRPVVLLPVAVINELTPAQVEAIITHELAHIRRHDYLVNLVQCVAETLLFYHPAVWWVGRVIRQEREHCCDDRVVSIGGDRANYALALTRLTELLQSHTPFALAATGGALARRIRRIVRGEPAPHQHRAERLLLAGLAPVVLTMSLIVYGVKASDTPTTEPEPAPTTAPTPAPDAKPVYTQRVIEIPKDKLLAGDASVNIVIRPGDVIRIAKAEGNVFIGGKIKRPGTYALPGSQPLTVKQLVLSAGGIGEGADGVLVIRRTGDKASLVFAATDKDMEQVDGPDLVLKRNDLVKVVESIRDQAKGARTDQLRKEQQAAYEFLNALPTREAELVNALNEAELHYGKKHPARVKLAKQLEALKTEGARLDARTDEIWVELLKEVHKQVVKPGPVPQTTTVRPEDLLPNQGPYRLSVGDVVSVSVFELLKPGEEHVQAQRIDEMGRIRLAIIGQIDAAGLTAKGLEQAITRKLKGGLIAEPLVGVAVKEKRGNTFSVIGDSKDVRTGVYTLTRPDMRLLEAIALVGGVPKDAQVFVIRQNAKPADNTIKVRAVIEREGKVISSPTITTRPGVPASIEIEDQSEPGDGVQIEVIPERSDAAQPSADPTQSHAVIGRVLGRDIRLSDLGLDADHLRKLMDKVWDDAHSDPLEPYLRLHAREALADAIVLQHVESA